MTFLLTPGVKGLKMIFQYMLLSHALLFHTADSHQNIAKLCVVVIPLYAFFHFILEETMKCPFKKILESPPTP